MRHPGYSGFLIWAVGTQVMLCNPLSTVAFTWVLWRFFSKRIPYPAWKIFYRLFISIIELSEAYHFMCFHHPLNMNIFVKRVKLVFLVIPSPRAGMKNFSWGSSLAQNTMNTHREYTLDYHLLNESIALAKYALESLTFKFPFDAMYFKL